MSNERFRISTNKIIENGIERVEFDPSKVKLIKDTNEIDTFRNEAERFMFYKYEDAEIALKIYDLGYCLGWGSTKVEGGSSYCSRRDNISGLNLFKRIATKLRKRPNRNEYSQASLDKHKERAESLDKFELNWAINQFSMVVHEFNEWYVEKQTSETINRYSEVNMWTFTDDKEIVDINLEIKKSTEKIKELKKKRFDMKCELVLNSIQDEETKINDELKQPLIDSINKQREKGEQELYFL